SNLLASLFFFVKAIRWSHSEPGMPNGRVSFGLDDVSKQAPSRMECDVIANGVRYQYGFRTDDQRVLEEWLYEFAVGSRHRILFHRNHAETEEFYFGPYLKGNNRTIQEQTRKDSLFLSTAGINNHKTLTPLWKFFFEDLIANLGINERSGISSSMNELESNSVLREQVVSFLREADTGISGMEMGDMPSELQEEIIEIVDRRYLNDQSARDILKRMLPNMKNIFFRHSVGSKDYTLHHSLESRGTQTMLGLAIQVCGILERGGVLVVDELESGLHPFVAKRLVDLFQDSNTNSKGAQLLFATHYTHLMTDLAPAQIWLCEKNGQGATEIYPLTAAQPRKGENLEHGYLRGRYGGVPYMGPIEHVWPSRKRIKAGEVVP
ncbi:MAG: ATP-binding protein, partial [Magnetococcales bacterium]|nr:ATP-binding protein [Magnetococcales bacterium]